MKLYVVRDTVAEESGPIFEAKNDGIAARNFKNMLQKTTVNFAEFRLLALGEVNHETDEMYVYPVPKVVDISMPIELVKEDK